MDTLKQSLVTEYHYDKEGRLEAKECSNGTKEMFYNSEHKIKTVYLYNKYEEKDTDPEEDVIRRGFRPKSKVEKFDDDGTLIRRVVKYANGNKSDKNYINVDENTKEVVDTALELKTVFRYNSNEDLVEKITYIKDNIEKRFVYDIEYDKYSRKVTEKLIVYRTDTDIIIHTELTKYEYVDISTKLLKTTVDNGKAVIVTDYIYLPNLEIMNISNLRKSGNRKNIETIMIYKDNLDRPVLEYKIRSVGTTLKETTVISYDYNKLGRLIRDTNSILVTRIKYND